MSKKRNFVEVFFFLLAVVLTIMPVVRADSIGGDISSEDKAVFDQILEPVLRIYNLVKYVATTIAALVLLFAGITYIVSGGDPKKRDDAKSIATYVFIGLIVIWATPFIIDFIV